MTVFFEDIKELKNYEAAVELFNEKNVPFKEKTLGMLGEVKVLTIQNEDATVFEKGIKLQKGTKTLYFIKDTVLLVSSSTGWSGRGEPHSTEAFLKVIKLDKKDQSAVNEIKENSKGKTLKKRYEELIIEFFNISKKPVKEKKISTVTKYDSLIDFAEKDQETFKQIITNNLNDSFFILNPERLHSFVNIQNIPSFIAGENLIEINETFVQKISKILKKAKIEIGLNLESKNYASISFAKRELTRDFKELEKLNIGIKNIWVEKDGYRFFVGFIISSGEVFKAVEQYVQALEKNIPGSLFCEDGNFIFERANCLTKSELLNKLNETLTNEFEITENDANEILKLLNSKNLK